MKAKLLTFVFGFALGIAAAVLTPRFLGPLLPAGLSSGPESVEGTVVRRQRDQERLLLTINTAQGAALATFTEKVAEIDLLVEEGDSVTLGLGVYEPFVENPPIHAVRKAERTGETVVLAPPNTPPEDADPVPVEPPSETAEPTPGDEPDADAPAAEAELEEWPAGDDGG